MVDHCHTQHEGAMHVTARCRKVERRKEKEVEGGRWEVPKDKKISLEALWR